MPIFEYRCTECGNRFDAFFRRAEDAERELPRCGRCGSDAVRKLFSVIGLGGAGNTDVNVRSGECGTRST
ncbi:MAG: zinc ribbon domain-containing protein [Actinobacteria bacterium]|nr:zinc ribbon domain-containing protein [Actinomycetota bacterium]